MNQPTTPSPADADAIRKRVAADYARVAEGAGTSDDADCCAPSCCEPTPRNNDQVSRELGYSDDEMAQVPDGSNLGLGCGNPQAIASLQAGEHVLDLGSGAGFDAFLAARQVGPTGKVIGVDMTPAMLEKARKNRDKVQLSQVEFRLGEIEALPLADNSIDVVISNCVINLSPEKHRVFDEVGRVLRPGGRVAVSDVVLTAPLPDEVRGDLAALSACVSGAASIPEIEQMLKDAGLVDIAITPKDESKEFIQHWVPGTDVSKYVTSASITATKPRKNGSCC